MKTDNNFLLRRKLYRKKSPTHTHTHVEKECFKTHEEGGLFSIFGFHSDGEGWLLFGGGEVYSDRIFYDENDDGLSCFFSSSTSQ